MARREAKELAARENTDNRDRTFFRRHIDQAMPRRSMSGLYDRWSKGHASLLSQLRTGKCRLNHYLVRIGVTESEACECGREAETVSHFLFRCPRWEEIRRNMHVYAQPRWGDYAYCVGAWTDRRDLNGRMVNGERDRWKPDMKTIRKTIELVRATKRFESILHA